MRQIDVLVGMAALLALGLGSQQAGCAFNAYNDCDLYPHAGCPGLGASSSGMGGSTSAASGGMGGAPFDCTGDPSPIVGASGNIRNECAVFVRADATDATPNGSLEQPYRSLHDALVHAAGKKKVFACTPVGSPFTEAVTLSTGLELYGGFDCSQAIWTWTEAGRSELDGVADKVALTITKAAAGALVSGWTIKGVSPSDPMGGGSCVGVAVDDVAVTIERSDISAADGAAGPNGQTPTEVVAIGQDAPTPDHTRLDACINPGALLGGVPGTTMCGAVATDGAAGGKGGITGTMSGDGFPGGTGANASASPPAGMDGLGGDAQTGSSSMCLPGHPGAPGGSGNPGSGGSSTGDVLTLVGVTNNNVTDGADGKPAQGGGGGGGTKSGLFCPGMTDGNGASGGGGGAGGCGGKGGGGGTAGGSSIAIITLGAKLTIVTNEMVIAKNVTLKTGKGGAGGSGAPGQNGGQGGSGKGGGNAAATLSPSIDGCDGGDGGKGGAGGTGGGGRGGYSAGIAFAKAPATKPTFKVPPTIGAGGTAGASTGNPGAAGDAGAVCDFSKTSNPCQ